MYDSVLLPTDGSPGAETARNHVIDLAADQGATLHVLHVVDVQPPAASLHEPIAAQMTRTGEELVETVARTGRERGLAVETAVLEGDLAETIVGYVASNGVSVVVMPTHGRRGLARAVVGSVTDRVVRSTEAPVLVVSFDA
jgi:nucleotide-binding universal stress UspA family protein